MVSSGKYFPFLVLGQILIDKIEILCRINDNNVFSQKKCQSNWNTGEVF